MRFIKGKSGFELMDKKTQVKTEEYELKRKELFGEIRSRSWWIPESDKFEKLLVLIFGRSNKWLSRPVKRYVCGKRRIDTYQFNCTKLIVEHVKGSGVVELRFHNIDDRFRFSVTAALMSEEPSMKRLIEKHIVKTESLYMLSQLWKRFREDGRKSGFGRWAVEQPAMRRLIEYRRNHITRDNLYLIM